VNAAIRALREFVAANAQAEGEKRIQRLIGFINGYLPH
jgi:hypothetical protein